MSSELHGLLEAIRERPDDDLPRLALADWLMEQPGPAEQARGEFIQLRCRAAAPAPDDPARQGPEQRARQLREQFEAKWLGALATQIDGWDFDRGLVVVELRRGFGRRLRLNRLANRPEWLWVAGVKGVLLDGQDLTDLLGSHLAQRLTALDLSDCEVGPRGASGLTASPALRRLAGLRLAYGRIEDLGASALASSQYLRRLTTLSLFAAGVGPRGAEALAGSECLPRLVVLDLGHNPLGPDGARTIAACSKLTSLTTLRLNGCGLTDRGAWTLVHANALNKIQIIDVSDNDLGKEAERALREQFGARVRL